MFSLNILVRSPSCIGFTNFLDSPYKFVMVELSWLKIVLTPQKSPNSSSNLKSDLSKNKYISTNKNITSYIMKGLSKIVFGLPMAHIDYFRLGHAKLLYILLYKHM